LYTPPPTDYDFGHIPYPLLKEALDNHGNEELKNKLKQTPPRPYTVLALLNLLASLFGPRPIVYPPPFPTPPTTKPTPPPVDPEKEKLGMRTRRPPKYKKNGACKKKKQEKGSDKEDSDEED
jgi:hypothetical protein